MRNVFNYTKKQCIRAITVIGSLQVRILMLTCFQVSEMMLLAVQEIFGRANIDMLIEAIDNGINARSRGDGIAVEVKWGYNIHTEETNPFFRHAPGCTSIAGVHQILPQVYYRLASEATLCPCFKLSK